MPHSDPNAADRAKKPAPDAICVVDDSETNRVLLRRRLEREGYRVVTAENGREALDCLHTEAIGLLLLDVMMPEMDGEEVLKHMQADDRLRAIPVIVVTALNEQESVQRCLQAGAKEYLLKPIDPVQLRLRVHAYFPRPPHTNPPQAKRKTPQTKRIPHAAVPKAGDTFEACTAMRLFAVAMP